jgi:REP element-mobilizing transposase RayT
MPEKRTNKGWHSRGYLPHLDAAEVIQAITFRLADALPGKVIDAWKLELERNADDQSRERVLRERIARFEDAGHGACVLRDPSCAGVVQDALLHFDGDRYRLLEWCVMPNHVHVLVHCRKGTPLGGMVKSWKMHSSRRINQMLVKRGSVWAMDYHDRYIRDLDHLANARSYIRRNPVKAGLCRNPEVWPWSSAGWPGTASFQTRNGE